MLRRRPASERAIRTERISYSRNIERNHSALLRRAATRRHPSSERARARLRSTLCDVAVRMRSGRACEPRRDAGMRALPPSAPRGFEVGLQVLGEVGSGGRAEQAPTEELPNAREAAVGVRPVPQPGPDPSRAGPRGSGRRPAAAAIRSRWATRRRGVQRTSGRLVRASLDG
jgi:hypothetical protein